MRFDACCYICSSLCNLGKCVRGLLASFGRKGPWLQKSSLHRRLPNAIFWHNWPTIQAWLAKSRRLSRFLTSFLPSTVGPSGSFWHYCPHRRFVVNILDNRSWEIANAERATASKVQALCGVPKEGRGLLNLNTRILTYQIIVLSLCKPTPFLLHTSPISSRTESEHLQQTTPCSVASSAPASVPLPVVALPPPHVHIPSPNTLSRIADTEEQVPRMSSTTDPLPPLGTAAHLPSGGLIAIVWFSVVFAGGFGKWILRAVTF